MTNPPSTTIEPAQPARSLDRITGSFRDPSGFLYRENGRLLRTVSRIYASDYDHFMASGLYDELVCDQLLVEHEEKPGTEADHRILAPVEIPFIFYPYEWCFSQLKDAALLTLEIQKRALAKGMILKDASAYNVQFVDSKPIFIDTLSFERYEEGKPWVAYRQFCEHFLAPLALTSYVDARLNELWLGQLEGISLDLAAKLLPFKSRMSLGLLAHIHLHARAQSRFSDSASAGPRSKERKVNRIGLLGLLANLESTVHKLEWQPVGTEWGSYYDSTNYSEDGLEEKMRLVREYLDSVPSGRILDLGANTGPFSRIAHSFGGEVISADIDPAAIEKNYLIASKDGLKDYWPIVSNLSNPAAGIGWGNSERPSFLLRAKSETILALALIHHLAISNNVPLGYLAKIFRDLGNFLIVEFVPKSDSQVKRLLVSRKDVFPNYSEDGFEREFSKYFRIKQKEKIQGTKRTLYCLEGK